MHRVVIKNAGCAPVCHSPDSVQFSSLPRVSGTALPTVTENAFARERGGSLGPPGDRVIGQFREAQLQCSNTVEFIRVEQLWRH
jgi:hypothetical protein